MAFVILGVEQLAYYCLSHQPSILTRKNDNEQGTEPGYGAGVRAMRAAPISQALPCFTMT
jgi:hypothetical protein